MKKQERIKVFLMEVSDEGIPYKGYLTEIDNTLEAKQKIVKGHIEVVSITDKIDIIMNEEGKFLDSCPQNRVWLGKDGKILDIIFGNMICCRHTGEEFSDIFEEDKEIILRTFKVAVNIGGQWIGIPEDGLEDVREKKS